MKLQSYIGALALMFAVMSANSSLSFAQVPYGRQFMVSPETEKKSDKTGRIFKVSNATFLSATVLDMKSTVDILNHPTCAHRADYTVLTCGYRGIEKGWTGKMFGKRNVTAAVVGNTLLNAGIAYTSWKLYQRGGKWNRKFATALLLFKTADNAMAGFRNVRYSADLDHNLGTAMDYSGRIHWSH